MPFLLKLSNSQKTFFQLLKLIPGIKNEDFQKSGSINNPFINFFIFVLSQFFGIKDIDFYLNILWTEIPPNDVAKMIKNDKDRKDDVINQKDINGKKEINVRFLYNQTSISKAILIDFIKNNIPVNSDYLYIRFGCSDVSSEYNKIVLCIGSCDSSGPNGTFISPVNGNCDNSFVSNYVSRNSEINSKFKPNRPNDSKKYENKFLKEVKGIIHKKSDVLAWLSKSNTGDIIYIYDTFDIRSYHEHTTIIFTNDVNLIPQNSQILLPPSGNYVYYNHGGTCCPVNYQ